MGIMMIPVSGWLGWPSKGRCEIIPATFSPFKKTRLVPMCQRFWLLSWLKALSSGSSPPPSLWPPESSFWNTDQILLVSGSESLRLPAGGGMESGPTSITFKAPRGPAPDVSELHLSSSSPFHTVPLIRTTLRLGTCRAAAASFCA